MLDLPSLCMYNYVDHSFIFLSYLPPMRPPKSNPLIPLTSRLKNLAKGLRPMSALPGGVFRTPHQIALEEELARRNTPLPESPLRRAEREASAKNGSIGPKGMSMAWEEEEDSEVVEGAIERGGKQLIDRTMACPEPWVTPEKRQGDDEYARPIIGRPANEIKMRIRPITRAPRQERRNNKACTSYFCLCSLFSFSRVGVWFVSVV